MEIDNMVEDNVVYFKNITSFTERLLCFKLRKAKTTTMKIWMLFILGILFFFLKQIELLEAASLNYNSNNKEKIHLY